MPSKFILAFLRVSVTILFYFLIFVTLGIIVLFVLRLSGNRTAGPKLFNYEVKAFGEKSEKPTITYSKDSLVHYKPVTGLYKLDVKPNSAIGYYAISIKLISLGLGIIILWNFMKIFKDTKLENPFKHPVTKRLKILAVLFIIGDIFKLANYIFFNHFIHQSVSSPRFELVTELGDGFVTGMIIWIIAVIYQRAIVLQEENALTV